jgi:hypothetical protein
MSLPLASALNYEICKDVGSTSCWFWDQEFAVFSKTLGQWEGNEVCSGLPAEFARYACAMRKTDFGLV